MKPVTNNPKGFRNLYGWTHTKLRVSETEHQPECIYFNYEIKVTKSLKWRKERRTAGLYEDKESFFNDSVSVPEKAEQQSYAEKAEYIAIP